MTFASGAEGLPLKARRNHFRVMMYIIELVYAMYIEHVWSDPAPGRPDARP